MRLHHPKAQLGQFKNDWLHAHYHFSFADYYNPERMGIGALRVINDDQIQPNQGFETHGHKDMEIITYVRTGAVLHTDSMGNKSTIHAGNVQVISAGTGIRHSEHSSPDTVTTLYQIWIYPRQKNLTPTWAEAVFDHQPVTQSLNLLVSGYAQDENTLSIAQDARIYAGVLEADTKIDHVIRSQFAYMLISEGQINVGGIIAHKGDAIQIESEQILSIQAITQAEILVIEV
jgi:hypothetical protein